MSTTQDKNTKPFKNVHELKEPYPSKYLDAFGATGAFTLPAVEAVPTESF